MDDDRADRQGGGTTVGRVALTGPFAEEFPRLSEVLDWAFIGQSQVPRRGALARLHGIRWVFWLRQLSHRLAVEELETAFGETFIITEAGNSLLPLTQLTMHAREARKITEL